MLGFEVAIIEWKGTSEAEGVVIGRRLGDKAILLQSERYPTIKAQDMLDAVLKDSYLDQGWELVSIQNPIDQLKGGNVLRQYFVQRRKPDVDDLPLKNTTEEGELPVIREG